jgi:hypothetical protein
MECSICKAVGVPLFQREIKLLDDRDILLSVFECPTCGFIYNDIDSHVEDWADLYSYPRYYEFDYVSKREKNEETRGRGSRILDVFHNLVDFEKVSSILICGAGPLSESIKHLSANTEADIFTTYGDPTNKRNIDLDTSYREFDVIISSEVAEHYVDPLKEFAKLSMHLTRKPESCIIASTSIKESVLSSGSLIPLVNYIIRDAKGGHVSLYSKEAIKRIGFYINLIPKVYKYGDIKAVIQFKNTLVEPWEEI